MAAHGGVWFYSALTSNVLSRDHHVIHWQKSCVSVHGIALL